jgi:hypothetical protein
VGKVIQMSIKTYSQLIRLPTFEDRFEYLKLKGSVGKDTFGHDRYLNQVFYSSMEWRRLRDEIIIRDNGCDLGIEGREIGGKVYIHHLNPLGANDILTHSEYLVNPEYLICVSFETHNAIHYGDINLLPRDPIERKRNDTCPWRR